MLDTFGPPESGVDKVDVEWTVDLDDGRTATVYNYKSSYGLSGLLSNPDEVRTWHIGGCHPDVAEGVNDILSLRWIGEPELGDE